MEEKDFRPSEAMEVDIKRLLNAVKGRLWFVFLSLIISAVITLLGTLLFITPKYSSSAMFYVNNNSLSVGDASFSITSSDISASKALVNSYVTILQTRSTLNDVIDYAGVDRTYSELKKMVTAEAVNDTEIFEVVVTSPDPYEAEKLANAIAYILPKKISGIIEGTSAKIVDAAVVASKPSSPSYPKNTVLGALAGFVLSLAAVVLQELFDDRIRTEDDIEENIHAAVLTAIPDMLAPIKSVSYKSDHRKHGKKETAGTSKKDALVGPDLSFAALEAYKLLRTKLQFSFAGDNASRVIGISSAMAGEGKSLTAINLAYTLSQLGKKVLLIDCDMRRPTVAEKLGIAKKPGLSGYLTGQNKLEGLIQYCGIPDDKRAFHVLTAGENPPNPIELLSSSGMGKFLQDLRHYYDYILLDLPPVGEVSDAMAVAKHTDGILLVVRQNYCSGTALGNAVRQFRFVNARILGVIYNYTTEYNGNYGRKYYKRYDLYIQRKEK